MAEASGSRTFQGLLESATCLVFIVLVMLVVLVVLVYDTQMSPSRIPIAHQARCHSGTRGAGKYLNESQSNMKTIVRPSPWFF